MPPSKSFVTAHFPNLSITPLSKLNERASVLSPSVDGSNMTAIKRWATTTSTPHNGRRLWTCTVTVGAHNFSIITDACPSAPFESGTAFSHEYDVTHAEGFTEVAGDNGETVKKFHSKKAAINSAFFHLYAVILDSHDIASPDPGIGLDMWRRIRAYLQNYRDSAPDEGMEITDFVFTAFTGNERYLEMPANFGPGHRDRIHVICAQLGMPHTAVHITNDEGTATIVAVVSNNLSSIGLWDHDIVDPRRPLPRRFRPWRYLVTEPDVVSLKNRLSEEHLHRSELWRFGPATTLPSDQMLPDPELDFVLLQDSGSIEIFGDLLSEEEEFAFDFETMEFNGMKRTCLFQIFVKSDPRPRIIDVLSEGVWESVSRFIGPHFENPDILKVGHSISSIDRDCLARDFGVIICNVFDTQVAYSVLHPGEQLIGLVNLLEKYHFDPGTARDYRLLKKIYQDSDWIARPLTIDRRRLEYAARDSLHLLDAKDLLVRDLFDRGLDRLRVALQRSQYSAQLKEFDDRLGHRLPPEIYRDITHDKFRVGVSWDSTSQDAYERLVQFRSDCASADAIHVENICSLEFLVCIALHRPASVEDMRRHCYYYPGDETVVWHQRLLEVLHAGPNLSLNHY